MMNGMNMNKMMKQMQSVQTNMKAEQEKLNATSFTGKAPDDMVVVTFTGDRKMTDMTVKPEAIDPDDPDTLSDLVIAAVNDCMTNIEKATRDSLGKYTKGLPGM
ncbi:DNA-binding protein, YbaB/EbfC family [Lentilactobacillus parafarraginis F0439]|uniref:Nucleoid-associated protein HMPREF9103_02307 n=1 Tax=Lentilactobacillus parafarraginis F0439 TaxID=797515 RepID=G9ZRE6_9LACO|nr:YbaB/EbfC family nucleoid-associated protein [Lentilactobacillus parafarraginis]EHL96647.1 DNA-binding protein, YbaB/EbfC family [Lentilactobacillus parafarraginis F0439]